jgi:hypothetical protein
MITYTVKIYAAHTDTPISTAQVKAVNIVEAIAAVGIGISDTRLTGAITKVVISEAHMN